MEKTPKEDNIPLSKEQIIKGTKIIGTAGLVGGVVAGGFAGVAMERSTAEQEGPTVYEVSIDQDGHAVFQSGDKKYVSSNHRLDGMVKENMSPELKAFFRGGDEGMKNADVTLIKEVGDDTIKPITYGGEAL